MSSDALNKLPLDPVKNDVQDILSEFLLFDDRGAFEKAVEAESHLTFNFDSVIDVSSDFLEATADYMILNMKDNTVEEPNNLMFLNDHKAFLYAKKLPSMEPAKIYQSILEKTYGHSTILAFIVLRKILNNYKLRLESLLVEVKEVENKFNLKRYHELSLEFERRYDRLEEFHDLILRLQERCYPQVDTEFISFDYRVLIAESASLQGRYRRRLSLLRDLRQDFETQTTSELNSKIVKLNDVVKKLTAITVILMIPNLIAGHFGMNFASMPELQVPWAYPAVIGFQFAFMGAGYWWFRKIEWL
jgi:Mg2+ and Co2+ transporter CorA